MAARLQEILIGLGLAKQADIATASGSFMRLRKLNASLANPKLNTENDAAEYGKGHEFITQVYKTSWDVQGTLEKYLSSEIAAFAMAYGLGKVSEAAGTYTCKPLDPVTDGIELPYFSFVEQIRPGANAVLDRMALGCAIEGWNIPTGSGPGRANSKINIDFVGSGRVTEPSAVEIPAATLEHLLLSASLTLTINSTNYVNDKNLVSLEAGWKNNLRMDAGFFPGCGFQTPGDATTGAVRGRMEVGDRAAALKFVARFVHGSQELAKLKSQDTGTAVIGLSFDAANALTLTYHKISYAVAEVGETDGLVTVAVECAPQYDDDNGVLTAVVKCPVNGIAQAGA